MTNQRPEGISIEHDEVVPFEKARAETPAALAHDKLHHLKANESAADGLHHRTESALKKFLTMIDKGDHEKLNKLHEMEGEIDNLLKEFKAKNNELSRKVSVAEARFDEGEDVKVAEAENGDYVIEAELTPEQYAAEMKAKKESPITASLHDFNLGDGVKKSSEVPWNDEPKHKMTHKARIIRRPTTRVRPHVLEHKTSEQIFDEEHGTNEDTRGSFLLTPINEPERKPLANSLTSASPLKEHAGAKARREAAERAAVFNAKEEAREKGEEYEAPLKIATNIHEEPDRKLTTDKYIVTNENGSDDPELDRTITHNEERLSVEGRAAMKRAEDGAAWKAEKTNKRKKGKTRGKIIATVKYLKKLEDQEERWQNWKRENPSDLNEDQWNVALDAIDDVYGSAYNRAKREMFNPDSDIKNERDVVNAAQIAAGRAMKERGIKLEDLNEAAGHYRPDFAYAPSPDNMAIAEGEHQAAEDAKVLKEAKGPIRRFFDGIFNRILKSK